MNATIRKVLHAALPHKSVRDELKVIRDASGRALRSLRMEFMNGGSKDLRKYQQVKLNIGCGGIIRPGWINLDLYPQPGAYYLDVVNGMPFAPQSALHIHCEHFVEHLAFDDVEIFLSDCHRILVPGGTMRIIVPDAQKYITAYYQKDETFFTQLAHLGNSTHPLMTPIAIINQMFRMGGGHKFAWDYQTLAMTAKAAGFSEAKLSSLGDVPAELSIDGADGWRVIESLYVNLVK